MNRRLLVAGLGGLALVAIAGAGAYVYFFSSLRTSPATLSLATPLATNSPTAASTGLAGNWAVASGSLAGYRVKELFAGETSQHEAVARTSTVTGRLTVVGDAAGFQVSAVSIVATLTDLHSVDQVAGRDVTQRDFFVARQMNLQQFPSATFTAASESVPGTVTSQPADLSVPGKLTIHGVTKDVTATARAQVNGDRIEIAGSISIDMTDYGISPPQVPFTAVDSKVVIEFKVFLTKTA
jgi:polyisoprenoid-binding protein YceI